MSLLHLPIPSLSSYVSTHALQTRLVQHLLHLKSLRQPLPPPLVLTMELLPTYTFGRRQQISPEDRTALSQMGTLIKAQRGGMTTFHGPGQLSPRCYVHALESSMISLCKGFGVDAFRTQDTGVWCKLDNDEERKLASIGVHLRRNITSHGVGINITDQVLPYFDVIDACGLGKRVVSLEGMGVRTTREEVERQWVREFGEEIEGDVYVLKDVGELEEIWGLKKGEILDVMIRSETNEIEM